MTTILVYGVSLPFMLLEAWWSQQHKYRGASARTLFHSAPPQLKTPQAHQAELIHTDSRNNNNNNNKLTKKEDYLAWKTGKEYTLVIIHFFKKKTRPLEALTPWGFAVWCSFWFTPWVSFLRPHVRSLSCVFSPPWIGVFVICGARPASDAPDASLLLLVLEGTSCKLHNFEGSRFFFFFSRCQAIRELMGSSLYFRVRFM